MSSACKVPRLVPLMFVLAPVAASAYADSADAVASRSPSAIARDFGRAGGDTYWQRREPTEMPAAVVKAYEATKAFLTQPPEDQGPERYGRAGGYIGTDILRSPAWQRDAAKAGPETVRTNPALTESSWHWPYAK